MERTSVQKLARVLRVLITIVFVCNIIALFFVPLVACLGPENSMSDLTDQLLQGISEGYVGSVLVSGIVFFLIMFMLLLEEFWLGTYLIAMTLFLWACGICTAVILWQGRQVLGTILKGDPFVMDNAKSLKHAAICCFLISGAALVRLIWGLAYYGNAGPLLSYNALFVPIFLMAGLVCMVMSALFRQAAELKAENDLTI